MKRRQFAPEFKAKVVMEMLRDERTISEIANNHELSPNQLCIMSLSVMLLKSFPKIGLQKRKIERKELKQDRNELLAKVGQLTLEVDWLKKSAEILRSDYEKRFNKR